MSDILIAGGASFVGSNFANYLMQHTKYSVSTLDNLRTGSLKNLAPAQAAKNRHTFYLADVKDEYISKKIFEIEKPSTVVYNCLTDAGTNWENDIEILRSFIWSAKLSFSMTNFVALLPAEYHGSIWEQAIFEVLEQEFGSGFCNWMLFKPCHVFGPRQRWGVVADTIQTHLIGAEMPNPDHDKREWMYIKDYFMKFIQLIDVAKDDLESGKCTLHTGQWASDADINSFVGDVLRGEAEPHTWEVNLEESGNHSFDLVSALEHTIVWYDKNRWSWK